jgi:hypothetical protein
VPVVSVGVHTHAVLPWFTWWGGRRSRGMVLCPLGVPDPLGVPVRHAMQHGADDSSGFHAGMGGTEAAVHPAAEGDMVVRPSDEEAPVSDQYDAPQTVRAGPRSDPDGDRADDVDWRRALSRCRPCYRGTRHPVRPCSARWCGRTRRVVGGQTGAPPVARRPYTRLRFYRISADTRAPRHGRALRLDGGRSVRSGLLRSELVRDGITRRAGVRAGCLQLDEDHMRRGLPDVLPVVLLRW